MELKFVVTEDAIIKEYLFKCGVSKRLGKKVKLYGKILVNGVEKRNWETVKPGDILEIVLPKNENPNIKKVKGKIVILYEDEELLIVEKEENLAVHPSREHFDDNLQARVLAYFEEKGLQCNCHILTRLDYATSGIVIICKDPYINHLMTHTKITKKYYALTSVKLKEEEGKICLTIARDESSIIKRKVDPNGKMAITLFKFLEEKKNGFLYELTLVTGRTHQIRVHLAYLGAPIVGDGLYEGVSADRLYLHCGYVSFIHPLNGEKIEIISNVDW
mgnify:CR=1 FL=1